MINASVDKETQKAINSKIQAQQKAETQAIKNQTAIDKEKRTQRLRKPKHRRMPMQDSLKQRPKQKPIRN